MGDYSKVVEDKINSLISEAKDRGFSEFKVEDIVWDNTPWYRLRFKFNNKKGYFDVSKNTFNYVSNSIILKEIGRELRL